VKNFTNFLAERTPNFYFAVSLCAWDWLRAGVSVFFNAAGGSGGGKEFRKK
jgi:hypothetical protein